MKYDFNSNELVITPNYDAILQDFEILEYNGRINRAAIDALRNAGDGQMVVSAVYVKENYEDTPQAFFLSKKGGKIGEALLQVINEHPRLGSTFKYREVKNPAHTFHGQENVILRLFLNSLSIPSSRTKGVGVSNLTGRLVCISGKGKKGTLHAVEVSVDSAMRLRLEARSYCNYFRKKKEIERNTTLDSAIKQNKIKALPLYKYNRKTLTMERIYDVPKEGTIYTRGAISGEKASVDHIKWDKGFHRTKIGIWATVLSGYNSRGLDKYVSFDFKRYSVLFEKRCTKGDSDRIRQRMLFHLNELPPIIVNLAGDDGQAIAETLQSTIEQITEFRLEEFESVQPDRTNIVIVYPPEYYDPGTDDHTKNNKIVIQHVTTENVGASSVSVVEFILLNLIVKYEIQSGNSVLIEPFELGLNPGWSFILPVYTRETRPSLGGRSGKTKLVLSSLAIGSINLSGGIDFELIEDPDTLEFIKYGHHFENANDCPEGIITSPQGDVMEISKSGEFVMWDALSVLKELDETDDGKESTIRIAEILPFLQRHYLKVAEKLKASGASRVTGAGLYNEYIKAEIKSNLKKRKAVADIYQQLGIRIHVFFKNEEKLAKVFGTLKGINLIPIDERNALYFVGTKETPKKPGKARAITIRRVVALEGRNRFEELLATMTPDYIKNRELTVVPWIFKYIREYVQMNRPDGVLVR